MPVLNVQRHDRDARTIYMDLYGFSHVKSLTDLLLAEPVDFSRVRKSGGQNLEERRRDYIRRYITGI